MFPTTSHRLLTPALEAKYGKNMKQKTAEAKQEETTKTSSKTSFWAKLFHKTVI